MWLISVCSLVLAGNVYLDRYVSSNHLYSLMRVCSTAVSETPGTSSFPIYFCRHKAKPARYFLPYFHNCLCFRQIALESQRVGKLVCSEHLVKRLWCAPAARAVRQSVAAAAGGFCRIQACFSVSFLGGRGVMGLFKPTLIAP